MNIPLIKQNIYRIVLLSSILLLAIPAFGRPPAEALAAPLTWRDDFDGPALDPAWGWVNENSEMWNISGGYLRIFASPYATGGENLLLRSVTEHDFVIETRLFFEPKANFQFAGLVIYQDADNYLQFGRAFCDIPDICAGNGIYFDSIQGGDWVGGNFATPVENLGEAYLRLERRGEMVRGLFSHDGTSWYEIGVHWIPSDFQVNGVGLTAAQDNEPPDGDTPADFDFFELSEGEGFLPEGFHDFDQGVVPNWACNAGGWAADPDDRAARLQVEIVADHQTVASLTAQEFRQDLLDAGVCEGGNCSFFTPLWGVISSYQPHTVDAWAQDSTNGEWVLLSDSKKSLTCRTYDIYVFEPLTATTQQVTDLRETHEFNPRWSPDGRKIVHDTYNIDWSAHGIYITDIRAGSSAPLAGAEGGSYPTWSPNGKWIAFDRGADNDFRVFLVPPAGGDPQLVRDDAFMVSWAPNSQRLAFHQPSDGSIRTMTLSGGDVTLVVAHGNGPAWSPNGQWIAYEEGGDIWKVQVNVYGAPFGEPIRLTSSPAWEGRPTWAANSKVIAFHAGMGQDTDIWTVPATGGVATWLTGAQIYGDYDANYANNSRQISYASISPDGQAPRLWISAFSDDPPVGTFAEGMHPYHFEFDWNLPESGSWNGQGGDFVISNAAESYAGYVMLRGMAEVRGVQTAQGLVCENVAEINPSQLTRFLIGWLPDLGQISYAEARAHFESITARAVWDGDQSAALTPHEIMPFNVDEWFAYACTFTEAPPKMDLRVNYGHDWVESFYEAGHQVSITVTKSDGTVKATATSFTEPKDFWGGRTGFQTTASDWSPAPPDLQPYDWVYAQVDNLVTAQVQLGDIQGEVRFDLDSVGGTIVTPWITQPVQVECLDWGSGQDPPYSNKDGGMIMPDGVETYSCSWEGEWDVQPWQDIGVGYFTPDGHWVANAFRDERWMAFWTYDPLVGFLSEGEHSYQFDWAYNVPTPASGTSAPLSVNISSTTAGEPTPMYEKYVLVQVWQGMPQLAWTGAACETISVVHPDQPMRFVWGWVNDYSMSYEEALAHFQSFTIQVSWDGASPGSANLVMGDLVPFHSREERDAYRCTLTEHP